MSNGQSYKDFPGTGTRLLTGNKFWTLSQAIIGPLVVAGIIWLVSDRNRAWNALESLEDELKIHEIEGKRRHEIIDRRLAQKRKEIDELHDGWRECQLDTQRLWIEIAKLPPDEWEKRILQNTRDISVLKNAAQ